MLAKGCITKQGYRLLYIAQHPLYPKPTQVLEHRFVMECFLGRRLTSKEIVHHKPPGDKLDNSLSNLELMTRSGHAIHHASWEGRVIRIPCVCQRCGATYERQPNLAKRNKYCGEPCRLAALHEGLRVVRPDRPCAICGTTISRQSRYPLKYCSEACRALGRGQSVSAARQRNAVKIA